jgi:NSS family neurotransmitter:Na+ symporter
VAVLAVLGFLGGIIFATGGGLAWLDLVDHFLSHYGLFVACILQCLLVGWIYGARHLRDHVNSVSTNRAGWWLNASIQSLVPGVLVYLLFSDLLKDLRQPYGGYPWMALLLIGRDWLLLTLLAALVVAMRPWRKSLKEPGA